MQKLKSLSNIKELLEDYNWEIKEEAKLKVTKNQQLILDSLSSEKSLDKILEETKIDQTEIIVWVNKFRDNGTY